MDKTKVVILAAGKGTRMGAGDLPKVLVELAGKPMIEHLIDSVEATGINGQPVLVVGHGEDRVRAVFGDRCAYVTQERQLGTGHAVAAARPALEGRADRLIVLYGDNPLYSADSFRRLHAQHRDTDATLTLATFTVPDFEGWRALFDGFGRIVRDQAGELVSIVERKDATEEQAAIREVSPGMYCFDAAWLWSHIDQLGNQNAQGEYYLTDLLEMAFREGQKVNSITIPVEEGIGINTAEYLAHAEALIAER